MTWFLVAQIVLTLAVVAVSWYLSARSSGAATGGEDMSPSGLDSFSITTAEEGSVVPVVLGRARMKGNIIYYGNLVTEPIYSGGGGGGKGGGGGGGDEDVIVGYEYYLDVWQAICMGQADVLKTYVQSDEQAVEADETIYNDGTTNDYPTQPGSYANRIPGVCHVWYGGMYLGENQTYVPTVHFIMDRQLPSGHPINYAVMSKGLNPAAIVYELLLMAGATISKINLTAFNEAADFWYAKGYGLNITLTSQKKAREWIAQVLSYVDGALAIDQDDRFALKAFDPNESASFTIETEEFLDFRVSRRDWSDTYNDFIGKYIDEDEDFVEKTVRARNPANIALIGRSRPKTIDLSAFRDKNTASKRIWEVMRWLSYPEAQFDFKTTLKFSKVLEGDVVELNNDEYDISSAEVRILTKELSGPESNEIHFTAVQMVETLFDDNYQVGSGSKWTPPNVDPDPFVYQAVFELPYNKATGLGLAFLLFGARVNNFETGFHLYFSLAGSDYEPKGTFYAFSQYGTLDELYPADTYEIDDDQGILYTPYREDPVFSTVSRTELFGGSRVAIIGDEIIRFQTVTPEGGSGIRLGGCIRGCYNTPVSAHAVSDPIWITRLGPSNVLAGIGTGDFYLKLVPFVAGKAVDISAVSAIHVTADNKATEPYAVGRILAERTGSSVDLTWWPLTKGYDGAGTKEEEAYTDTWPFNFDGAFEYKVGAGGTWTEINATEVNISSAPAFDFYIRNVVDGRESDEVMLAVGSGDGEYVV